MQIINHRIYARLRNCQFFSREELNAALSELLAHHKQNRVCLLGYKFKYYTVNRLLDELKLVILERHELKCFEKMVHFELLIIDDFGMKRLDGSQQNDFELKGDSMRKKY